MNMHVWWNRSDVISGRGICQVLSCHSPGDAEKIHEKPRSRRPMSGLTFKPYTFIHSSLPLVDEEAPLLNTDMSRREQKSWSWIWRRLKPGMSVLARNVCAGEDQQQSNQPTNQPTTVVFLSHSELSGPCD
jgi:hypothetical protein